MKNKETTNKINGSLIPPNFFIWAFSRVYDIMFLNFIVMII